MLIIIVNKADKKFTDIDFNFPKFPPLKNSTNIKFLKRRRHIVLRSQRGGKNQEGFQQTFYR